jgi:hypothetical protein
MDDGFILAPGDWDAMNRGKGDFEACSAAYTPRQWTSGSSYQASALASACQAATKTSHKVAAAFQQASSKRDQRCIFAHGRIETESQAGARLLSRAIARFAIPQRTYRSGRAQDVGIPTMVCAKGEDAGRTLASNPVLEGDKVQPDVLLAELKRASAGERPTSEESSQSAASAANTVRMHDLEAFKRDFEFTVGSAEEKKTEQVLPITERKLNARRPPPVDPEAEQVIFSDFDSPEDFYDDRLFENRTEASVEDENLARALSPPAGQSELAAEEEVVDSEEFIDKTEQLAADKVCSKLPVQKSPYPFPAALARHRDSTLAFPGRCLSDKKGEITSSQGEGKTHAGELDSTFDSKLDGSFVLGELRVGEGCPRPIRSRPPTPLLHPSTLPVSGVGCVETVAASERKAAHDSARAMGAREEGVGGARVRGARAQYTCLAATHAVNSKAGVCLAPLDSVGAGAAVGQNVAVGADCLSLPRLDALDRDDGAPAVAASNCLSVAAPDSTYDHRSHGNSAAAARPLKASRSRSVDPGGAGRQHTGASASDAGVLTLRRAKRLSSAGGFRCQGSEESEAEVLHRTRSSELGGGRDEVRGQREGEGDLALGGKRTDICNLYRLGRPSSRVPAWR